MITIFVYGTLRIGEVNHHFLHGAKFVAEKCWIYGELFDTGYGYPGIKEHPTRKVYGEVYEVTAEQLRLVDELEDYVEGSADNLYERVSKQVQTEGGIMEALVYVAGKGLDGERIDSGDWKDPQRV